MANVVTTTDERRTSFRPRYPGRHGPIWLTSDGEPRETALRMEVLLDVGVVNGPGDTSGHTRIPKYRIIVLYLRQVLFMSKSFLLYVYENVA